MKRKQSEERLAELANTCFSDLLLETSSVDTPDRWKGMTKEELNRIRREQLEQIDEKRVGNWLLVSLTTELFSEKDTRSKQIRLSVESIWQRDC